MYWGIELHLVKIQLHICIALHPTLFPTALHPHTLPHCTPHTYTPSLFHPPPHTLPHCSTHPLPKHTPLHYRYKGQKTPLNFVHLNLSVVLFLALCLFVGGGWYLRKFKVRMYLCVRVCVCVCMRVCVCVCVHECVQKSCLIAHS